MAKSQRELWLLNLGGVYIFTKGTEEEVRQYLEKMVEDAMADYEDCYCDGVKKWEDKYLYATVTYETGAEEEPTAEFKAIPLRKVAAKPIGELLKACEEEKKE
jgi:CRISPR/Cas system-associated endonuclease/helicase Cas3